MSHNSWWVFGALLIAYSGCAGDTGTVELNWRFVDRTGAPIFPAGQLTLGQDACGLSGRAGPQTRPYDLQIELNICDPECIEGCDDPRCAIITPERFGCDTARATVSDVPASPNPYLFIVNGVIMTDEKTCVTPPPTCIAVPGPRERTLDRGRVVDLQVYQIGVNIDLEGDAVLDLEACDCA